MKRLFVILHLPLSFGNNAYTQLYFGLGLRSWVEMLICDIVFYTFIKTYLPGVYSYIQPCSDPASGAG